MAGIRALISLIVTIASLSIAQAQTFYQCNGVTYNYPFPGCTYSTTLAPGATTTTARPVTYFLCNGVLSTSQNPACTFNLATTAAPVSSSNVVNGTPLTALLNTSGTRYYFCNGQYYTYPPAECQFPAVSGKK